MESRTSILITQRVEVFLRAARGYYTLNQGVWQEFTGRLLDLGLCLTNEGALKIISPHFAEVVELVDTPS